MKAMRKIRLALARLIAGSEIEDVKAFQKKFGIICNDKPVHVTQRKLLERIDFLQEELNEFTAASNKQDIAELADALIDLVYVAKGTAISMGLPWDQLWDDVQRANMSKVPGATKRGHRVDATKPNGWKGPATLSILLDNDYRFCDFKTHGKPGIDEEKCHDDK